MAQSLKTNYLLLALGVILPLSPLLGGLAYYELRVDTSVVKEITDAAVGQRLEAELEQRAMSLGKVAAANLGRSLGAGDLRGTESVAQRLLEQPDVERVEITDSSGALRFSGAQPQHSAAARGDYALQIPVTTDVGSGTLQRVGELHLWVSRASLEETLRELRAQLDNHHSNQGRRVSGALLGFTAMVLALGLTGAWYIARQLARPITALVKTADRIGEGDYTRPLAVMRRDELGELQSALERMRQNLRETTITKNYLTTVLNSLSDAVLVTSPDGVIKSCNGAAQTLLGFGEGELLGKPLIQLIDAAHRQAFDDTQTAAEGRETVFHTARGQTIPVSIASSPITTDDPQFQGNIYVARNITERKRAERRIRYMARYDTLTKMPNRMQFQHLLQQAIARSRRNHRSLALLYLDLDRFKEVNDTFGHSAGDRTLEILSERLTRNLSKDTVIGRLAGDEFAMFVDDLPLDEDNRIAIGVAVGKPGSGIRLCQGVVDYISGNQVRFAIGY